MKNEAYLFGDKVVLINSDTDYGTYPFHKIFKTDMKAQHTVNVIISDNLQGPDMTPGNPDTVCYGGGVRTRHLYNIFSDNKAELYCVARTENDKTELEYSPRMKELLHLKNILNDADIFFILSNLNAVVLHSSLVSYKGRGIVFTGNSGIGKSTQAALWEKFAGASVINGDRSVLSTGNACTAGGICFSGTSGICKCYNVPLSAIIILGKSSVNKLYVPSGPDVYKALMRQCAYSVRDNVFTNRVADIITEIAEKTAIYGFECRPDETAVKALAEGLKWI